VKPIKPLFAAAALAAAPLVQGFELTSSDIQPGKLIPKAQVYKGYGCDGGNRSPQLAWSDVPAGTESFAVTASDPDAPTTGKGWWHWILLDIPAGVRELPSGAGNPASGLAPAGSIEHRNDFGTAAYGGPCPPAGDKAHRYQFKVFALDVAHLDVDPHSPPASVGHMLNAHELGVAELQALYRR
jgi:Raf kinase inhibitor-like YbhB/YbcL family protein